MRTLPTQKSQYHWKLRAARAGLALLFLGTVSRVIAQPAKDAFANRTVVAGAFFAVSGNNEFATREPGEPTAGENSVWWAWTAPTSGVYTVTAVSSQRNFSPFVGVYTGPSLSNLATVAINSNYDDYTARVVINAAGGTTYALAVTTVGGLGSEIRLSIAPTTPPSVSVTSPTNNATVYMGEPFSLSADALDSDGTVTNVVFYLDFAPVAAFTNGPYQLNVTLTNGPGFYYRFQVRATDNWGVTSVSGEVFFLFTSPPPANDSFTSRSAIMGASISVTGNNEFATREPGEPTAGDKSVWWAWTAPTSGVYTVTAVSIQRYFSPFVGVYNGSSVANLTTVANNSDYDDYTARVVINAVGGTTYALAVTTVGGIGGEIRLNIAPTVPPSVSVTSPTNNATVYVGEPVRLSADAFDSDGAVTNVVFYLDFAPVAAFTNGPYEFNVTFPNGPDYNYRFQVRATDNWGVTSVSAAVYFLATHPPPANDDFSNRAAISGVPVVVTGNNRYATRQLGEPTQGDRSVWWSWTAPTSGTYTVTAVGLGLSFYPFLGVYTGSTLSNLVLVGSNVFNGSDRTYAARVMIAPTGGTTYALAVTTVGGIGDEINLCITPPAPAGATAKFESIARLPDGSFRLVFTTEASSLWGVETSTNLSGWERSLLQFLPNGLYDVRDYLDEALPRRFYRLKAEP